MSSCEYYPHQFEIHFVVPASGANPRSLRFKDQHPMHAVYSHAPFGTNEPHDMAREERKDEVRHDLVSGARRG